jgi:hypothetical protein
MELDIQTELVKVLLPEGLLNYFEITKVSSANHEILI